MNDPAELRRFALVHARGQRIAGYRDVLAAIVSDDGAEPGSWVGEWTEHARGLEQRGRLLDASRSYGMARFPYVDGPARAQAARRAVELFDRWRAQAGIAELDVPVGAGRVRCWAGGLAPGRDRPVLLVAGGIVTPKEQWASVLAGMDRLGMTGVVAELPGVGENPLTYDAESWRLFPAILEALDGRADTSRTYALALSFAGHLALRAAARDERIRGIVTVGAPIRRFFVDEPWQRRLPRITLEVLERITAPAAPPRPARSVEGLAARLSALALEPEELAALRIPVHYLTSLRDEIIPPQERDELARIPGLRLTSNDDVHGSPAHALETRLWSVARVAAMRGGRPLQAALLGALARVAAALPARV